MELELGVTMEVEMDRACLTVDFGLVREKTTRLFLGIKVTAEAQQKQRQQYQEQRQVPGPCEP